MCEQLVGVSSEDTVLALSFPRYAAATGKGFASAGTAARWWWV